jgi:hypothetical protein
MLGFSKSLQIPRAAAYENLSGRSPRSFISLNTSRPFSGCALAARPEIVALYDTTVGSASVLKTSYPSSKHPHFMYIDAMELATKDASRNPLLTAWPCTCAPAASARRAAQERVTLA